MKGRNSLAMVRKHFPEVTKVVDATESIRLSVKKLDVTNGRKKDPSSCALAKACVRELHANGAIINISFSYVIKGNKATRYTTSTGVGREITSFDRHGDFAEGKDYLLQKVSPSNRLGMPKSSKTRGPHTGTRPHKAVIRHTTSNIRVSEVAD